MPSETRVKCDRCSVHSLPSSLDDGVCVGCRAKELLEQFEQQPDNNN